MAGGCRIQLHAHSCISTEYEYISKNVFRIVNKCPYTSLITKTGNRRPLANYYVLLIHLNPLQGSRLRTTATLHGRTWNGEGVCRFHALTNLCERTRTFFPKSSANTPPHTPPQDCGRPRSPTNDHDRYISRRKFGLEHCEQREREWCKIVRA